MMILLFGRYCLRFVNRSNGRLIMRHVYVNCLKNQPSRKIPRGLYFWSSKIMVTRIMIPLVNCNFHANSNEQIPVCSVQPQTFWQKLRGYLTAFWDVFETFLRGVQLLFIFTPLIVLFPVTFMGSYLKILWFELFLMGIEFSGPVIIKLGQWASTRQDLFSIEFCACLAKLQHDTKPHTWMYTKRCFEEAYGTCWDDIILHIDNDGLPIGSGCCAQVYKAWIKEEYIPSNFVNKEKLNRISNLCGDQPLHLPGAIPVAVKVRHPKIEKYLRQDISVLKFLAVTLTYIIPKIKWLSLPECVDDFSQMMKGQVNFYMEAHNLNIFTRNFSGLYNIKFPTPIWPLTRSNILVETFEEGQHAANFIKGGKSVAMKKHLADIGVHTIFKMVFEDNFIHGDLHPGNMLVKEEMANSEPWFRFPWITPSRESLILIILDCGIVSSLDEREKKCLRDVFSAVVRDDGDRVAELFLEHSNHECSDVLQFKSEVKDIVHKALSNTVSLQKVDVSVLMNSVFSTMIRHKVKVEGSFTSVILSIMVLEGFGRSLDPSIDIVEKAKPFLFNDFITNNYMLIFQ